MSKIAKPAIIVKNVNDNGGGGGGGGGGDGVKLALLSFPPETVYALKSLISHDDSDPYGAFYIMVATTDSISDLTPGSGEEGYAQLTLFSELATQGEAASLQSFSVSVPTGRDIYAFVLCLSGNVSSSDKLSTALYDVLGELIQEVPHAYKSDNGSTILSVGSFSISEDLAGSNIALGIYND